MKLEDILKLAYDSAFKQYPHKLANRQRIEYQQAYLDGFKACTQMHLDRMNVGKFNDELATLLELEPNPESIVNDYLPTDVDRLI